jgi:hypothetical protein
MRLHAGASNYFRRGHANWSVHPRSPETSKVSSGRSDCGALKVLLEIGQKPVPAPGKRFILQRKATHQGLISYYRADTSPLELIFFLLSKQLKFEIKTCE